MSDEEQPKRGLFGRLFRKDGEPGEAPAAPETTTGPAGAPDAAEGEAGAKPAERGAGEAPPGAAPTPAAVAEDEVAPVPSDPAADPATGEAAEPASEETAAGRRGLFSRMFRRREEDPGAAPGGGEETPAEGGEAPPGPGEPAAPAAPDEPPAPPEEPPAAPEGAGAGDEPGDGVEAAERPGAEAIAEPAAVEPAPGEGAERRGLFGRLRGGLSKTRKGLVQKVDRILLGKKEIDADTLEELEEALVSADLGVRTSLRLIEGIQEKVSRRELTSPAALREHLREEIRAILVAEEGHFELGAERPQVLLVVGVNGVGKTTTIGKIAAQHRQRGHKVLLAAGDTFRAAACEQLQIWGERVGAAVIRHQDGSDPAAVAFDAVEAARARGVDLVIVDTAGRLHTKGNLMEELKKMRRVIGKAMPGAPHQVLLVLDATTGQNAISQARIFDAAVGLDGIALTKLDGTAKGGVIVGICDELKTPVQFIGIGEQVDDLRPFDAAEFVDALF